MKKLFTFIALVLSVVSCMKDQAFEAGNGSESKVVLSVALPDGATRAAGADSAVGAMGNIDLANEYDIRYILAVYDANGTLAKAQIEKFEDEATSTQFELRLVPGRDYRFVVWADFVAEGTTESLHYNTADLTNVTLKAGQLPMDESRDAYTAVEKIEKFNSASEVKLTLTRPFAKLRVVTNDMNEIYSALTQATVTYTTKVYTAFNALTAEAGEPETITEKVAVLNNDAYKYTNETGTAKMTLFADYLFGAEDDKVTFTMNIEDATGFEIPTINFNTNIPVERNHLTTIYGPILTDFNQVTVGIDDAFDSEYELPFYDGSVPQTNEIWYTNGSTTKATTPNKTDVFGANVVSNTYDADKECWILKFDGEVTKIGGYAFSNCSSLTDVVIPESVTSIGADAFWCCSRLKRAIIPDSVKSIGNSAFYNCDSLTSVKIPDSVTTISGYAFYGCDNLEEFNGKFASVDGRCLIVKRTLNSFAPAGLTEYTIPDSVTTIGSFAFYGFTNLSTVTIPESVTSIASSAFYNCSGITSMTIPSSVTSIGDSAFSYCDNLQEFKGVYASEDGRCLIINGVIRSFASAGVTEYIIPNGVTSIGADAFSGCSRLTSVVIPDSVTSIGIDAFEYCSNLTSVTIPNSVTSIGRTAFTRCDNLTSVTIPDSVTTIGGYAFLDCDNLQEFKGKFASEDGRCLIVNGVINSFAPAGLTEYTIHDGVTTIGDLAFNACRKLVSVTIPASVTTIKDYPFSNCNSLKNVYCKATTPPAGGRDMFKSNTSGRKIYVPTESVDAYKSASYWKDYASDIVGYDF